MKKTILFVLTAATLFNIGCAEDNAKKQNGRGVKDSYNPKVVYGDDNRLDYYQVTDTRMLSLADSTVALIRGDELTPVVGTSAFEYDPTTFEQAYSLCKSEPFREQPSAGFCSGFLVAKNLVATAGHCIRTATDCSTTKFVFGYQMNSAGANPTEVDGSQIYSCSKIIHSVVEMAGKDYAVIQLDREVTDHSPLRIRRTGAVQVGDGITVVGYPSGIPMKISGGANVRKVEKGYFVANLDTYGGNSGSAVFNSTTGDVEGILVRGETDFVAQGSCRVSKRCANEECRGEDVTLISETLTHIPEIVAGPVIPGPVIPGPVTPDPVTPTPAPGPTAYTNSVEVAIPDNSSKGISSTVVASEAPRGRKVKVKVDITHSYRGDLKVTLVAPNGKKIDLIKRSGKSAQNLVGTFGGDLVAKDLAKFSSIMTTGVWTLKISDHARRDTGKLNSWSLVFE